jgi:AAHS family 4-hydroxybenzoate transporter-like MFS transporter
LLSLRGGSTYPTALRATGLGWAFGAGRFGGIVGSLYGGALFSMHLGINNMLYASAVPLFVAAIAGLCLSRTRGPDMPTRRIDGSAFEADAIIASPDHLRIKP